MKSRKSFKISWVTLMNITPRINLAIRPKEDASEFNISSNRLKEYCKSQELTPVFEVIKMLGPAHSREFIISCKVKDYATQGIDLLKKNCLYSNCMVMEQQYLRKREIQKSCKDSCCRKKCCYYWKPDSIPFMTD